MRIAFFISNHGFGHVMRNLPVAEELIRRGHEVVIVTGAKQGKIAEDYLNEGVEIISCDTDAGLIVEPGTIRIDQGASFKRIEEYIGRWPELIEHSPDADRYVVDIAPWALIAAKEKGIPSYLMASFTWLDQYRPFLSEDLLQQYKSAFECRGKVLYYDLVNEPTRELLGEGIDVGFVARPFHEDRVAEIRVRHKRPIVFLSLGASNSGLDFDIDVDSLPYDFITTQALRLKGSNVEYLDQSVENTQDYVKAADYCIAKAGWSTVAEIMLAGVRSAVLERDDTPEDIMTIEEVKKRNVAISITVEKLKDMSSVMEKLQNYNWQRNEYTNNYQRIAEVICGGHNGLQS